MTKMFSLSAALLCGLMVVACNTRPLGVVSSIEVERELGVKQTPIFLQAKGGLYDDAEVLAYLRGLMKKLSAHADIPEAYQPIPIKIINSSEPSAYTLPGGTIYVSRGMIAMAKDEAQLATVIAHEIGHVISRHIAEGIASNERLYLEIVKEAETRLRFADTRSGRKAIVEEELAARLGDISAFSKEQELQADQIGVKIARDAGYSPSGFGDLLIRLNKWQERRAARMGVDAGKLAELSKNSGYPKIDERVAALPAQEDTVAVAAVTQDPLMSVIDEMSFDDRYDGGYILDGTYWNPGYELAFSVPDRLIAEHGENLRLVGLEGIVVLRFDNASEITFDALVARMSQSKLDFRKAKRATINGVPAVTATTRSTEKGETFVGDVALFDMGDRVVTLILFTKEADLPTIRPLYTKMVQSFRRLPPGTAPASRAYAARRISAGETASGIAAASRFDGDRAAELRLLNSLSPGAALQAGDWIKLVK